MFVCPHCQSQIQDSFNGQFCPICNSFIGNIKDNIYIQSQGYTDFSKYNKNKKKRKTYVDPNSYYAYDTEERINGYPFSTINAFLCENNEYYLEAFRELEEKKLKFHVPAFIFGSMFFLYRKMYLEALISFLASIILSFLFSLPNSVVFNILGTIIIQILFGLLANLVYFNRITTFLNKNNMGKRRLMDIAPEYMYKFSKYGGVNKYWIFLILSIIILIIILTFSTFIPYSFYYF